MKRLKMKVLSVVMSLTMTLAMIPNNVFAQSETSVSSEEVVSSENLDFAETTTPTSIELRGAENNRTFDIQEIDYRRSSVNPGMKYESRWEGVVPYGPLFGHMVNNGKYTRPLGKENGDLGWGWGSSDYMTGYLLVDLEKFGEQGTEGLPKDENSLSNIGIVRVDNKYSRNDDFSSWKESIEEAFKEYNGNEGFTEKGYAGGSAYQETKLVIWDGYKRERKVNSLTKKEYIGNVYDVDASNTSKRQELANYIKKHLDNEAKLQGYITTDYGLKDVYEPSEYTYRAKEKQIRYVPHIKITGVTYDVELEYENAPEGIELPKVVEVNAEETLNIKNINGYTIKIVDIDGNEYKNEPIEKNSKYIVNLRKIKEKEKEPFGDIGEAYYKQPKPEDIVFDEESGVKYVKNQLLISAFEGLEKRVIEDICKEIGANIVGYIQLTNDYQIEFTNDKTLNEISDIADYLNSYSFISTVTLNMSSDVKIEAISNDAKYKDDPWDEQNPEGNNWGLEALNVPSAWDYRDNFSSVKVGIYDEGFDEAHEDLAFDDISNNTDDVGKETHGTHVAGIIAATHNNGIGVSGVSTNTKLYAYSFSGNETGSSMGNKYAYVTLIGNNVKVINVSLGFKDVHIGFIASHPELDKINSDKAKTFIEKQADIMEEFLSKLVSQGFDFVICNSAGNSNNDEFVIDNTQPYGIRRHQTSDGTNQTVYSGNYDAYYNYNLSAINDVNLKKRIIVVGAIKNDGNDNYSITDFSNIGSRVDFVAPGQSILSTIPNNSYETMNGTSMASPYVAGIVAMMYQANPNLDGSNIKDYLSRSSTKSVTSGGYTYLIPNALGAYKQAINAPQKNDEINWPSGIVTGYTKKENGEVINDVKITAIRKNTGDYNLGKYHFQFNSDEQGTFVQKLPQGTYDLVISKDGYLPYVYNDVVITPEETTYLETIFLSIWNATIYKDCQVQGNVKNALTGQVIDGATIKLRKGWNKYSGSYLKTLFGKEIIGSTNSDGDFAIKVAKGMYTAEISRNGYITAYYNVISGPSGEYSVLSQIDMVMTPVLSKDEYRIVLTWGSEPNDLDSHLTCYDEQKKRFHVYYSNKEVSEKGKIVAKLDLDDTSSYGPETVTTTVNADVVENGSKLVYSVHDYTNRNQNDSTILSNSGATIHVYSGNTLIKTFSVPNGKKGNVWKVFEITNAGIKSINAFYNCSDPREVK